MSSSEEVTLRALPDYWNTIVKELKEVKARVGAIEARLDTLKNDVPEAPPEEEAANKEAEL